MNHLRYVKEFPQRLKECPNSVYLGRNLSQGNPSDVLKDNVKSFEDVPGPKPLPVIGNLWRYSSLVGEYSLHRLHSTYFKMYQKFGPLVKEKVFLNRMLVHAFDPNDMLKVYMNEGKKPVRISHRALEKYRQERPEIYSSPGLFPSNGDEWHRFRHLFQKILLSPQRANKYLRKLEDITNDMVKIIPSLLDESQEMDIQPLLFKWALECIGMITLNRRLGCLSEEGGKEAEKLVAAAHDTHQAVYITEINPLWKYFSTPSYTKLVAAQDLIASVVRKYIDEVMNNSKENESDTLLSEMLNVPSIDQKDIFTMILDMFLAGIDTTAYTSAFGLYNLAINEEVQEKLFKELETHLPRKDCSLAEKKQELSYLGNVLKETLRMNPVSLGTGRALPTDLVLSGYRVPKNTIVVLQHQVASQLSKHFTEPQRFLPDRWDKNHPSNKEINRNVSSPFGFGPRLCIGRRFAEREMIMLMGKVIRTFKISYAHQPIDSRTRLINVPDKPVKLRFEIRPNSRNQHRE